MTSARYRCRCSWAVADASCSVAASSLLASMFESARAFTASLVTVGLAVDHAGDVAHERHAVEQAGPCVLP
jgi:hypothetical protein